MASRFGSPNRANPIWLQPLLERQPACMDARTWGSYVAGVRADAITDPALRRALERGVAPSYCADCTAEYAAAMRERALCRPPVLTIRVRTHAD